MSDNVIKEEIARLMPYAKWIKENSFDIENWVSAAKVKLSPFNFDNANRKLNIFGYSMRHLTCCSFLWVWVVGGREALCLISRVSLSTASINFSHRLVIVLFT